MVQNRSEPFGTGLKAEPNPWNQYILVQSGSVTFVVWFWFEPVPNRTMATLSTSWPKASTQTGLLYGIDWYWVGGCDVNEHDLIWVVCHVNRVQVGG